MKFYSFDTRKRKKILVGEVIGNTLFKNVIQSRHFMRVLDGYGIQYIAFCELRKMVKKIVIKEDTGNQWEATIKDWTEHSKIADYGNGKQVFLSLKFMKPHKKVFETEKYIVKPEEIKEKRVTQTKLF